ncbi:MAG: hypothetical protein WKG03_22260, partial [Telluria sp.]
MRCLPSSRLILLARLLGALALLPAAAPAFAAEDHLRLAESDDENVLITASPGQAARACVAAGGRTSPYLQQLHSEAGEDAVYLKAARMGGGIYMHLPYLLGGNCKGVGFQVSARHILWDGKWHSGSLSISSKAARDKSVFFTNEVAPL